MTRRPRHRARLYERSDAPVVEQAPTSRSRSRRSPGTAASPAARQPVLSVSPLHVYLCIYLPTQGTGASTHALDLRQFTTWCRSRSLNLFAVRRADIESFARDLEAKGRARATVTRRLSTIAGFYKYAVEEELLEHSPAVPAEPLACITQPALVAVGETTAHFPS